MTQFSLEHLTVYEAVEQRGAAMTTAEISEAVGRLGRCSDEVTRNRANALVRHGHLSRSGHYPVRYRVAGGPPPILAERAGFAPRLLSMLRQTMWCATVDLEDGGTAAGCAFCGAERPANAAALCGCELGKLVAEAGRVVADARPGRAA